MTDPRSNGTYGAAADADLHGLVEAFFRSTFSTDNPIITEAVKRMLAAGGKRLRPRITLLAAAACGGNAVEHLHLAAYMELIHVATLIHDDVVDNARTRRGVNATAVDYGNRVSVLAGDYLFAWIFKNVTADYPHPIPARAFGDAGRHLRRRGAAAARPRRPRAVAGILRRDRAEKNRFALCGFGGVRRDHGRGERRARWRRCMPSATRSASRFR